MLEPKDIYDILDSENISYEVILHEAIYTIDNNADFKNKEKCVKNLFLRDDKKRNYYLLVVEPTKSVNLKELQVLIHSRRLSFANENDLYDYLGLIKGSVTPLGILNNVDKNIELIFDTDINGIVGVHPLVNDASVFLEVEDLKSLIRKYDYKIKEIKIP